MACIALAIALPLGDVPCVVSAEHRKPFWLFPNLLSLDAPLVAVVWLYLFVRTWRLGYLPWEAYVTLGLAVWVIYVADRLLDVALRGGTPETLESRHRFHHDHRRLFRLGLIAASLASVFLVVTKLGIIIYKHLMLGGVLVAGFFGLSMLTNKTTGEAPLAKNVLAGVTFAFGTAMTAHMYRMELGLFDLFASHEVICFAVLCILNISAIDLWEHAARASDVEIKASDELALTLPLALLGGASFVLSRMENEQSSQPFFYAVLTGSALLFILNLKRAEFSMDALRVLADVTMLAPLLVFQAASAT